MAELILKCGQVDECRTILEELEALAAAFIRSEGGTCRCSLLF